MLGTILAKNEILITTIMLISIRFSLCSMINDVMIVEEEPMKAKFGFLEDFKMYLTECLSKI